LLTAERNYSIAVQHRYKDAYFFANSSIKTGDVIKMLAGIVAVIVVAASLWGANQFSAPGVMVGGILIAALVGVTIYLFGMLIAAQGQVLMALLDTALNTSPYLDENTRAEAMSLGANLPPATNVGTGRAGQSLLDSDEGENSRSKSQDSCPHCGSTEIEFIKRYSGGAQDWRCSKCSRSFMR
jgi:hypothetical protein